jgi:hypothetical protein
MADTEELSTHLSDSLRLTGPVDEQQLEVLGFERVKDKDLSAPPGSVSTDDAFIVAAGATGLWSGHSGQIAKKTSSSWSFSTASTGWTRYVDDEAALYAYDGDAWVRISRASDDPDQAYVDAGDAAAMPKAGGAWTGPLVDARTLTTAPSLPEFSATPTLDFAARCDYELPPMEADVIATIENAARGQSGFIQVEQDDDGTRAFTLVAPDGYTIRKNKGVADLEAETGAGALTLYSYVVLGTNIWVSANKAG